MTQAVLRLGVAAMVVVCSVSAPCGQVFRTAVDAVLVPVSVLKGRTPLHGLTANDFELSDRGVRQRVMLQDIGRMPVDVTLLVDVSGSVSRGLAVVNAVLPKIAELLARQDRIAVMTFSDRERQLIPLQDARAPFAPAALVSGNMTSLFDGLISALIQPQPPQRRRLVVAFTDGWDNQSLLGDDDLLNTALRSDAVLDAVLSAASILPERQFSDPEGHERRTTFLKAVAGTSGQVYSSDDVLAGFRLALDNFHNSYLLSFTPEGVNAPGWHELTVRLRAGSRGTTVRARRAYWGG